jgi:hypothetical protein
LIKERARQGIDQVCFDLIPDASPSIRKVSQALTPKFRSCVGGNGDLEALFYQVLQYAAYHLFEYLGRDIIAYEIEDDHVLTNAIEEFWTVEDELEMAPDLGQHFVLDFIVALGGGDVQNSLPALTNLVYP